jgi:hypothetical protein
MGNLLKHLNIFKKTEKFMLGVEHYTKSLAKGWAGQPRYLLFQQKG